MHSEDKTNYICLLQQVAISQMDIMAQTNGSPFNLWWQTAM